MTKAPCFINTFGSSSLIFVSRSALLRSDLEDPKSCSWCPESVAGGELHGDESVIKVVTVIVCTDVIARITLETPCDRSRGFYFCPKVDLK